MMKAASIRFSVFSFIVLPSMSSTISRLSLVRNDPPKNPPISGVLHYARTTSEAASGRCRTVFWTKINPRTYPGACSKFWRKITFALIATDGY